MREILFRGKREDNNEFVYGLPYELDDGKIVMRKLDKIENVIYESIYHIKSETIGQYIGLDDNYSQKIFDGDIVEFAKENEKEQYLIWYSTEVSSIVEIKLEGTTRFDGIDYYATHYKNNWFDFALKLDDIYDYYSDIKIIGNVFDNPELIKLEINT